MEAKRAKGWAQGSIFARLEVLFRASRKTQPFGG
jgi:hypothetical protein